MDHIILVWLPSLTYIKMRNHLQLDMREHLSTMGGRFESCIINKGFLWSTFSINSYIFFNFTDDLEYERAFAALDELNLSCLKSFFKKEFLQVLTA